MKKNLQKIKSIKQITGLGTGLAIVFFIGWLIGLILWVVYVSKFDMDFIKKRIINYSEWFTAHNGFIVFLTFIILYGLTNIGI